MTSGALSQDELRRLLAIQRAVQRLATLPEAPSPALLEAVGAEADDARELGELGEQDGPGGLEELGALAKERRGVYGGLVGRTIEGSLRSQLPLTCARLGAESVRALTWAFLRESPPRSRYLRDVPFEVAIWASERWRRDAEIPDFLADLARYELLAFAVASAERGPAIETAALDASLPVRLDGTVRLARLRHAVHVLSSASDVASNASSERSPAHDAGAPSDGVGGSIPERVDVALLLYRDAEHEVHHVELTSSAVEIVLRLAAGAPLGTAIHQSANAVGRPVDSMWIDAVSALLADLAGRGLLTGTKGESLPEDHPAARSPYWAWLVDGDDPAESRSPTDR